jgi:hypothetical protein
MESKNIKKKHQRQVAASSTNYSNHELCARSLLRTHEKKLHVKKTSKKNINGMLRQAL